MSIQQYFSREAPIIEDGSKDYIDFRNLLINIDLLLEKTEAEKELIEKAREKIDPKKKRRGKWVARFLAYAKFGIRCNILRRLLKLDYRAFAVQACDSQIIQWFLRRGQIDGFVGKRIGKGLSKSSLERFDKLVSGEAVESVIRAVVATVSAKEWTEKMPGWNEPVSVRDIYVDCTCLEAGIHFPVDWVLLRDVVRTLILSIQCLRRHGLKNRIKDPKTFLREINQLCITMSAVSRKKDSKKRRKQVLREMKKVVECVEKHAERYRQLLAVARETRTDLTEAEAAQIVNRIETVLTQLPTAIKQAEDRIIRGHQVVNSEKILNLYEPDVHVIFRGKAGASVEFGNKLYIAENKDGLIVDFELFRDSPPADSKILKDSVARCISLYGGLDSVTSDRGFDSPDNTTLLSLANISNNICPKSPSLMANAFKEPSFRAAQKRRAQTEGRIGILKNVFLGDRLSGKGFDHQRIEVAWSILVHNFWVLGRLVQEKAENINPSDKLKKSA